MSDRSDDVPREATRPRAVRLLAMTVGLLLGITIVEVAPRLVPPLNRFVTFGDAARSIKRPNDSFVWKGQRVGRLSEFRVRVRNNALGYHERDYPFEKPVGVSRVLVLGDSQVEALQVQLEDSYHELVERRLRDAGHLVEVVALGRSGNGAREAFHTYRDIGRRFSPDIVVWGFTEHNDVLDADRELQARIQEMSSPSIRRPPHVLYGSVSATLAFTRSWRPRGDDIRSVDDVADILPGEYGVLADWWNSRDVMRLTEPPPRYRAALDRFAEDVRALIDAVQASGASIVVFSTAPQEHGARPQQLFRGFEWEPDKLDRLVSDVAESRGAAFVNAKSAYSAFQNRGGGGVTFLLDGHLNEDGHRVAADVLYPRLAEMIARTGEVDMPVPEP